MFSFLNGIPQVTRNILILNVLMFLLTLFFQTRGIELRHMLSIHAVNSPLFEPYQIISHFFMHANFMHLFMNMFGLVMFGGFLERIWGSKRFFIFFVSAAIGSWILSGAVDFMHVLQAKEQLLNVGFPNSDFINLDYMITTGQQSFVPSIDVSSMHLQIVDYIQTCVSSSIGASGAIFGILAAFTILFPNTELMLLFFPFPIKAKYLIGAYVLYEIYMYFNPSPDDNIDHLAHIGGAITGAILVLFWRKNRKHFY